MIQHKIEINKEVNQAFDLIEKSGGCVFITDNAGTGKTTFLHYLPALIKRLWFLRLQKLRLLTVEGKQFILFFILKQTLLYQKSKKRIFLNIKKVETIVINEVFMFLDSIDKFLRLNRQNIKNLSEVFRWCLLET
jgi:hypothetical protein